MVDVGTDATSEQAGETLSAEVTRADAECRISLRGGKRYGARLVRAQMTSSEEMSSLKGDATYLVTGGLRGLGLMVGEWLAEQGARHLVLVGRSEPNEASMARITKLRESGVDVKDLPDGRGERVAGEVSDGGDWVERSRSSRRRARGGVVGAVDVVAARGSTLRAVWWRQSGRGVDASRSDDGFGLFRDVFVGASSLGVCGSGELQRGEPVFGFSRALPAQPGTSCGEHRVGQLVGSGHLGGDGDRHRSPHAEFSGIPSKVGLQVLGRLLTSRRAHMAVMPLNLRQYFQFMPASSTQPLYAELRDELDAGGEAGPVLSKADEQLLSQIREASPEGARDLLQQFLREQVAKVMRLGVEAVGASVPLMQMGLDSLMSLELRNRIEQKLGVKILAADMFSYPSVDALAGFASLQIRGADVPAEVVVDAAQQDASPLPDLENTTSDELNNMILEELVNASDELDELA